MATFRGGFTHSLDEKGRIIIPLKYRLSLGEKFIITRGLGGCLWIFTEEEFRKLDDRINAQPAFDPHAVRLNRFLSSASFDGTADGQGRVALPVELREYAGIDKEAMIVGAGNKLEIWSKDRWDVYNASLTDEAISESARELGIG